MMITMMKGHSLGVCIDIKIQKLKAGHLEQDIGEGRGGIKPICIMHSGTH